MREGGRGREGERKKKSVCAKQEKRLLSYGEELHSYG